VNWFERAQLLLAGYAGNECNALIRLSSVLFMDLVRENSHLSSHLETGFFLLHPMSSHPVTPVNAT
jgi:hypothetical protein